MSYAREAEPAPMLFHANHYSPARRARLEAWSQLAERGDPFLQVVARAMGRTLPADRVQAWIDKNLATDNPWRFAQVLGPLHAIATAANHPDSPVHQRGDLIDAAGRLVDTAMETMQPDGAWVGVGEGDPNANRFALVNLLSGLRYLQHIPALESRWPNWRAALERAIERQRRAYDPDSELHPTDYAARFSPHYANMDAAYIAILGVSATLLNRPDLADEAHRRMEWLHEEVLPGGGLRYLQDTDESPNYHRINTHEIALYHEVTGDPSAARLLQRMGPYLPTVLTADGDPAMWTAPWWKQTWLAQWTTGVPTPFAPSVLAILARHADGQTREPLRSLMWAALSRLDPTDADADAGPFDSTLLRAIISGVDAWPDKSPDRPAGDAVGDAAGDALDDAPANEPVNLTPPADALHYDTNRRGLQGHHAGWYFGVTQGRSQRSTLIGAMATKPGDDAPVRGILRGVFAELTPDDPDAPQPAPLVFSKSEPETPGGLAWSENHAAVGAAYTLQPGRHGDRSDLRPTPWMLTQSWIAGPTGIVGMMRLTADDPTATGNLTWRAALGPNGIETLGEGEYRIGVMGIQLRVLDASGEATVEPWPGYGKTKAPGVEHWPSVISRTPFRPDREPPTFAVWIGPVGAAPPDAFEHHMLEPRVHHWTASWSDGPAVGLVHNATNESRAVADHLTLSEWSNARCAGFPSPRDRDRNRLTLLPGGVLMLQR